MSTERVPENISPSAPVETERHVGHGGTAYEAVDASAKMVIYSLGIIAGTLIVVFAITVGVQKYLQATHPPGQLPSPLAPERIVPPTPQIEVHPWETLPDVRAYEDKILSGGKDAQGRTRMPIDQAMDAVVSRLNIRPDSPSGIRTPGGEGRDFGGSLSAMPPAYQAPQIRGEIRKSAQQ
ncbi:MAG: hypothetical protein JOY62_15475 [Acidobacteriaceae bacterium]|nr:hypothetical protein [Acidobacteriaceae bacterium]MBV9781364.1 hypothetical protein [Acidobacteriaceae bacterium]